MKAVVHSNNIKPACLCLQQRFENLTTSQKRKHGSPGGLMLVRFGIYIVFLWDETIKY